MTNFVVICFNSNRELLQVSSMIRGSVFLDHIVAPFSSRRASWTCLPEDSLHTSIPYCHSSNFWLSSFIVSRFYYLAHSLSLHLSCYHPWQFGHPLPSQRSHIHMCPRLPSFAYSKKSLQQFLSPLLSHWNIYLLFRWLLSAYEHPVNSSSS